MVTIHESIVYGALGEVLGHLHRVSEHFRNHQQQDTANLIARLCVNLVEAVEGGMGHILENQSIVGVGRPNGGEFIAAGSENPVSVGIQQQATMAVRGEVGMRESESRIRAVGKLPAPPGLTTANSENPISAGNQQQETMAVRGEAGMGESETRICAMGRLPAPPGTTAAGFENSLPVGIQQQATMAVGGGVDIRENEIRSCAIGKLPAPPGATIQPGAGGWAQIANRPDTARPSQGTAQLMSPSASISGGQAVAAPPAASPEPVEEKAGVVRIYGSATKGEFRHITSRIHEGPLQEVRVESNNSVRVVFQHVSHALEFVKSDEEMQERLGQGRIGKGYTVEMADIINWNDDLRRMKQPVRERRRLSFARKGLLTGGLTAAKWKHEMLTIAGSGNVDFLWVFNSGNATAVFSSTIVARKVLDTVNRWKEHRREYSGVSVGYSSDTCEKELDLLRENNQPCYRKHAQPKRFMPPPRRPDYRQG